VSITKISQLYRTGKSLFILGFIGAQNTLCGEMLSFDVTAAGVYCHPCGLKVEEIFV
jgi:hypothetical protein